MILNTYIEDIVNEIKSGKRDLFDIIKEYEKRIHKLESKIEELEDKLDI